VHYQYVCFREKSFNEGVRALFVRPVGRDASVLNDTKKKAEESRHFSNNLERFSYDSHIILEYQ
jgi:hypothetical protein